MSGWSRSNIWDLLLFGFTGAGQSQRVSVLQYQPLSVITWKRIVNVYDFSPLLSVQSYLSNFFPILFRLTPLTILGAIMFKVSSPCFILVEEISFGVVHFLSLAVIFVFEFGLFFFGGESSALALRTAYRPENRGALW